MQDTSATSGPRFGFYVPNSVTFLIASECSQYPSVYLAIEQTDYK